MSGMNAIGARQPVILSGARAPIGKFMGGLSSLTAPEIGAVAVREAVRRAGIDPQTVDEVIMGTSCRQARTRPRRGRRRSRAVCRRLSAP
jgi:acetyl-CoA acetyltransferase